MGRRSRLQRREEERRERNLIKDWDRTCGKNEDSKKNTKWVSVRGCETREKTKRQLIDCKANVTTANRQRNKEDGEGGSAAIG